MASIPHPFLLIVVTHQQDVTNNLLAPKVTNHLVNPNTP
jgi:hypothetical protein